MEPMIIKKENQAVPAMSYARRIDRRPYTVRVFFPLDNAETMQQKIERALRDDLITKSTYQPHS